MKKIKNAKQGFTLLELLIVVLIIGILTAVALPQYKMAVGKAKLASIKNATESILQAEQRYFLTHNEYTNDLSSLDIEIPNTINCFFRTSSHNSAYCRTKILGVSVEYANSATRHWRRCIAYSRNENDTANKVCKQDTGGNAKDSSSKYIYYNYP